MSEFSNDADVKGVQSASSGDRATAASVSGAPNEKIVQKPLKHSIVKRFLVVKR